MEVTLPLRFYFMFFLVNRISNQDSSLFVLGGFLNISPHLGVNQNVGFMCDGLTELLWRLSLALYQASTVTRVSGPPSFVQERPSIGEVRSGISWSLYFDVPFTRRVSYFRGLCVPLFVGTRSRWSLLSIVLVCLLRRCVVLIVYVFSFIRTNYIKIFVFPSNFYSLLIYKFL